MNNVKNSIKGVDNQCHVGLLFSEQSRAEQSRAEQSRAEQSRAELCDILRHCITLLCAWWRKEHQQDNYTSFPLRGGCRFSVATSVKTIYRRY